MLCYNTTTYKVIVCRIVFEVWPS